MKRKELEGTCAEPSHHTPYWPKSVSSGRYWAIAFYSVGLSWWAAVCAEPSHYYTLCWRKSVSSGRRSSFFEFRKQDVVLRRNFVFRFRSCCFLLCFFSAVRSCVLLCPHFSNLLASLQRYLGYPASLSINLYWQLIGQVQSELCETKVKVDDLGSSPSLIVDMVSVDIKQSWTMVRSLLFSGAWKEKKKIPHFEWRKEACVCNDVITWFCFHPVSKEWGNSSCMSCQWNGVNESETAQTHKVE